MAVSKTCDICRAAKQKIDRSTMKPISDVHRYTLRREIDQTWTDGKRSRRYQKSMGGIDLCGDCWGMICQPRMNPKKASNPSPSW